jgi:hypothetical protein
LQDGDTMALFKLKVMVFIGGIVNTINGWLN